ncbi:MAG TPA: decarboxylating 6-phosphogluconate dehydrogenase [Patescibacteria group bacterium]
MEKTLGIIGLGKMGAGLAQNLADKNWRVVAYNRTHSVTQALASKGVTPTTSIEELIQQLPTPRVVWLMLPAGAVTDEHIDIIAPLLEKGDIVVEGANSYYEDAAPRAKRLAEKGITMIDVGVSGGPGGARNGACLMIGGDKATYDTLEPLFKDLARNGTAYQFFPGTGAGHFAKMVHNGIEYGMMQAIAEGFAILKAAPFNYTLTDVTKIYNDGSVIESRLTQWLESGYTQHGEDLADVSGTVKHTGEGEWTVNTAKKLNIPAPIIEGSFQFRVESEKSPSYTGQVLSVLREQFGGHSVK